MSSQTFMPIIKTSTRPMDSIKSDIYDTIKTFTTLTQCRQGGRGAELQRSGGGRMSSDAERISGMC